MFKEDIEKIADDQFIFPQVMDYWKESLALTLEREIPEIKKD